MFFVVVSIVGFVQLYFRAGRSWLAGMVCGLRLLALIVNFLSVPNLNYKEIVGLHHLPMWGGETISAAKGVPNPWVTVSHLSLVLMLIFVVDASMTLWRRGDRIERRRALVVGGSITFCILVATVHSALLNFGLIRSPYIVSFTFLAIVAAMGYERIKMSPWMPTSRRICLRSTVTMDNSNRCCSTSWSTVATPSFAF